MQPIGHHPLFYKHKLKAVLSTTIRCLYGASNAVSVQWKMHLAYKLCWALTTAEGLLTQYKREVKVQKLKPACSYVLKHQLNSQHTDDCMTVTNGNLETVKALPPN